MKFNEDWKRRENNVGANVRYFVKVLKTTEGWVEVSALTASDAKDEAEKLPGVIKALEARDDMEEGDEL